MRVYIMVVWKAVKLDMMTDSTMADPWVVDWVDEKGSSTAALKVELKGKN